MKFQASDFDSDFLMEEIDISSLADSSSIGDPYEYDTDATKGDTKGDNLSTQHDLEKS